MTDFKSEVSNPELFLILFILSIRVNCCFGKRGQGQSACPDGYHAASALKLQLKPRALERLVALRFELCAGLPFGELVLSGDAVADREEKLRVLDAAG